jgi:methylglutaconyl-CoA hydratase
MSDEIPLIVENEGEVLTLTLNNIEKKNALTSEMMGALSAILEEVDNYDNLRAIVIRGNGSVFCSGADINTWNPEELQELLFTLSDCPIPTIAHVHGICFGGGMGLASACDFVIAEDGTKFGFPEVKLGMIPAVISPYVSRKISIGRMRELFITGESFGVKQAYDFGFLYSLEADIDKLIQKIIIGGPLAQSFIKKLLSEEVDRDYIHERDSHLAELITQIREGSEGQEGIAAFMQKRFPSWRKE